MPGKPDRLADELGDEPRRRFLIDFARRSHLNDASLVHQRDPVGKRDCFGLVVGDDERRRADDTQDVAQLDPERLAQFCIQIGQRLIKEQELGRDCKCARQRDALLLPAAQRHRAPLTEPFEAGEAKQLVAPTILFGL